MSLELIEEFRKSQLFQGMDACFLQSLAEIASPRSLKKGEIAFLQGEAAAGFMLITSGAMKVLRTGADGREQLLHIFGVGEVIGEVPVFTGGRFPATAIAERASKLVYLSRDGFLNLGRTNPEILLSMLAILSKRLREFVELVDDLSLKDVSARLARYLIRNTSPKRPELVRLELAKSSLASKLGTIAATLSRTFKKLSEAGAIEIHGSTVKILDKEILESFSCGEAVDG